MARLLLIMVCMRKETQQKQPGKESIEMKIILNITKIMEKKITICSMAILVVCLWATASFAAFSRGFSEDGIYNGTQYGIVKIEIFNLSTSTRNFASPGAGNFSTGSWTVQMPNPSWVLATNATPGGTNSFDWTLFFAGNSNKAVVNLAYLAYTSTGEVYGTYINFNKGSWSYTIIANPDINDPRFNRTGAPVPVPPTVFLLGAGLIGMAVMRKRVHKQDSSP
jgi:hypothetical protein